MRCNNFKSIPPSQLVIFLADDDLEYSLDTLKISTDYIYNLLNILKENKIRLDKLELINLPLTPKAQEMILKEKLRQTVK
mgnify:CR=1 FL=1